MTRTPLTDTDRRRLGFAAHEAGHAVVGVLYGATVQRAALANDSSDGVCTFTGGTFGTNPRGHRSLIAAAGAVAAAVFHHGRRPTLGQIDRHLGPSDREDLRRASLSSLQPLPEQLTEVLPIVVRCWGAISELAPDLYLGREIGHADVCAVLGLADNGGPGSVGLAMIRSGSAPGTFTASQPGR